MPCGIHKKTKMTGKNWGMTISIVLFYALVYDFFLILGSSEHPRQKGIKDK